MSNRRLQEAEAERDFLVTRFLAPNFLGWHVGNDVGLSSNSLIAWAMGYVDWEDVRYPLDRDDYGRCERATANVPEHLRERMTAGLARFDAHLRKEGR